MRWPALSRCWLRAAVLLSVAFYSASSFADGVSIELGQSAVSVDGPWRFHLGDVADGASSALDDGGWESVNLAAAPGSHDADVGLSNYVAGWGGRGHAKAGGFGWYRIRLKVSAPAGETLALLGPSAVDSAYQIFWNGQLLGGSGDFDRDVPRAFSIQPRLFPVVSRGPSGDSDVLAIRVWMGAWDLADPQAGGIRSAPFLGTYADAERVYRLQWLETLRGYIVEVIEALGFFGACAVAWALARFSSRPSRYWWLYVALLLTGAYRLNQALFFWGQFESVGVFELLSSGLLYPLGLATWTLFWMQWVDLKAKHWTWAWAGTTVLYAVSALLLNGVLLGAIDTRTSVLEVTEKCCRLVYLVITAVVLVRLIVDKRSHRIWLVILLALVSIGQFAPELSQVGVPGIWFPFGAGVSRAQFAYALFFLVGAILFLVRIRELAAASTRHAAQEK